MKISSMTISKKTSAKVYVRIFPQAKMNWDYVSLSKHSTKIRVRSMQDFTSKKNPNQENQVNFRYYQTDGIFTNQSQAEIYAKVTENFLQGVFLGNNAIIMAYGQTGSGKTSTITGLHYSYEDRGILPRLVPDLFDIRQKQGRVISTRITMSYVEFNKLGITDLLKPLPNHMHSTYIKYVTKEETFFEEDVLKRIFLGESRKTFSYAHGNPSNLGSSVLTFTIARKNVSIMNATEKVSKIHIVDFAGSDTVGRASCSHRETADIGKVNTVKSQIEQFIMTMGTDVPEQLRVKQRLNAFTQYFGNCFTASVDVRVIGHITTHYEDLMITHSMLRFGQYIGGLTLNENMKESIGEESSSTLSTVKELEMLRQEKLYQAIFMNEDLCNNLNQDRLVHMKRVAQEYINEKTNEITVLNVTDANIVLKVIRDYCKELVDHQKDLSAVEYKRGFAEGVSVVRASFGKHMRTYSKATVQSRESNDNISDKKSIASGRNPKKRESVKSDNNMSLADDSVLKKKPAKVGSSNRKITTRRRSSSDVTPEKKDKSASQIEIPPNLPEHVPAQEEAWNHFINDDSTHYRELSAMAKENEIISREVYVSYSKEVARLKSLMESNEKRKDELLQAVMIRHYSERNLTSDNGATDAEKSCLQAKKESEKAVLDQQEVVLRIQAELRIHLKRHHELKKDIEDCFDKYCKTKYSITTAGVPQEMSLDLLDEFIFRVSGTDVREKEMQYKEPEEESLDEEKRRKYKELRVFMYKETKRNDTFKKNNKSWV